VEALTTTPGTIVCPTAGNNVTAAFAPETQRRKIAEATIAMLREAVIDFIVVFIYAISIYRHK
jgi:hypothetical protein